jgi:hypothetical protein
MYNLHILIRPVISPSEVRRHKIRGAWQRDPHLIPYGPALPVVPYAATNNRVEGGQE